MQSMCIWEDTRQPQQIPLNSSWHHSLRSKEHPVEKHRSMQSHCCTGVEPWAVVKQCFEIYTWLLHCMNDTMCIWNIYLWWKIWFTQCVQTIQSTIIFCPVNIIAWSKIYQQDGTGMNKPTEETCNHIVPHQMGIAHILHFHWLRMAGQTPE